MGGPIIKTLAENKEIAASGTFDHYFFAGERKGPVRVYLRFTLDDTGNPNLKFQVWPVIPGLDGTSTVPWPDWTGSTTLPNVVPDNGIHLLAAGAAASAEGCVFIAADARVSQFKVTVTEIGGAQDALYTLVAELL